MDVKQGFPGEKKTHIRPESLYKSLWSTREAKKKLCASL